MSATIHVLNVMPDHVHAFVETGPTCPPVRLAGLLKGYASRVLRTESGHLRHRVPALWPRSYCIGTVGHVSEPAIRRYIETQRRA